jgi:hypothetical protein
MTMDQAAVFLAASILVCVGVCVITCGILIVNNLFVNFWKPVTWFKYLDVRYPSHLQQDPPMFEEKKDKK